MRLNNKVLVTLGIVWLGFFSFTYWITQEYLVKSFLRLEDKQINTNISRVHQALDQVSSALGAYAVDWAHWNEAYDYIQGDNPAFVPNNLDTTAMLNMNINLLMYLNKQGEMLVGIAFDTVSKKQVGFPIGLEKYIYPGSLLEHQVDIANSTKGLISLPDGIMMVSAAGTSYTDLSQPINGVFIAGRWFSQQLLQNLANATSLGLTLYPQTNINKNKTLLTIYDKAIHDLDNNFIDLNDAKLAHGYTILYDIYKKPIGMLRVDVPRGIYNAGLAAVHFYLIIFMVAGFIIAMITWLLLRFFVLKRIEYLNKNIKEFADKKDYTQHIKDSQRDEIGSLGKQFNLFMDTINHSHEQLKNQLEEISSSGKKLEAVNEKLVREIQERKQMQQKIEALHQKLILAARRAGMADIASGVLHNVGNILNNVTTSIGITREMVVKSRSKNLTELAKLLEENKTNLIEFLTKEARGDKIIDYLNILAGALLEENLQLSQEVHHLDKNISHIKDVISMQQSLSSVIGMVEQVKISDVIDESLMLNKAVNENNHIQVDTDYRFNDPVELDRVKLLHVLVNLIKNAIESINEIMPEEKHLWIRVYRKDETFFVIEVKDNGKGILPENNTNIFNYGFTTKKNGSGIGLHTSASFVKEMGGQLNAVSQGENKGAVFILELPVVPLKPRERESEVYFQGEL